MSFATLNPHPALLQALQERGYASPTPVQALVLGGDHRGRDLLVSAQTGSGKTVAFGLAMADELLGDETSLGRPQAPLALVIAPTRELALQVQQELTWLYGAAGARIRACVGGMEIRTEIKALREGAHVVVGTPGRLCDHLDRGSLDLSQLKALVLDEADEMLDMGFREDLERILADARPERRTLMFSATIPPGIAQLAARYQRDALRITATPAEQAHQDIEYRAYLLSPREREHAIVNTLRLHDPKAALVFCMTRDSVSHLQANLVERGFEAVAISGELTQSERVRALKALRDGRAQVLVATDVAARGLDLPALDLVIQADLPRDAQVMQHRSGRTGRAGRKGISVLLVPRHMRGIAERMLRTARAKPAWLPVPSPEQIRTLDEERLMKTILAETAEVPEEELELAGKLLAERTPEQLAAALVRRMRAKLPQPEEISQPPARSTEERSSRSRPAPRETGPSHGHARPAHPAARHERREAEGERPAHSAERPARGESDRARPSHPAARHERREVEGDRPAYSAARPVRGESDRVRPSHPATRPMRDEPGEADGVWFHMNVGRLRNADPKWLVPLICRRGGITKAELGKIQIQATETRFLVSRQVAPSFARAAGRPDQKDPGILIEPLESAGERSSRGPRRPPRRERG